METSRTRQKNRNTFVVVTTRESPILFIKIIAVLMTVKLCHNVISGVFQETKNQSCKIGRLCYKEGKAVNKAVSKLAGQNFLPSCFAVRIHSRPSTCVTSLEYPWDHLGPAAGWDSQGSDSYAGHMVVGWFILQPDSRPLATASRPPPTTLLFLCFLLPHKNSKHLPLSWELTNNTEMMSIIYGVTMR